MSISGSATAEGTARYQERLQAKVGKDHFRKGAELTLSSIGIGTYLGDLDQQTDKLVSQAVLESVKGGINLIDTAINYRAEQAEKSIAIALAKLIESGDFARDEIVLCSKGGYLPAPTDPVAWFEVEYVKNKEYGIKKTDLVAGIHCLHPRYIYHQLECSLANLGVDCIDVYYVHNPETQLAEVEPKLLYQRLSKAFEVLEAAASQGKIKSYGLATWNALRTPAGTQEHIDLFTVKELAKEAAGSREDHFHFVQIPFNLAMMEALMATQQSGDEAVPVLEAARLLGLQVVSSASICQAQIIGQIPGPLAQGLGQDLSDAQRGLQFTRSSPGFISALVGMKQPEHVKENLALAAIAPLTAEEYLSMLNASG
jgi:aryl-alcohol dehydrogenase-like predicted oxidoreductase